MSDSQEKVSSTGPCKKPCKTCPWGIETSKVNGPEANGAFITEGMMGQVVGPFWLPCHMGYMNSLNKQEVIEQHRELPQCAGAANFRANMELDNLPYHLGLLKGEKDESVFSSPIEFVAYHKQIPTVMAYYYVSQKIVEWRDMVMADQDNQNIPNPKL